ncbi:ROK family protein [Altererythrobacter sp. KTW20L]|uniref:ROK family protein n=1 Tax=Altererythrobacter sp. KTW20L TaxID=2942210 RepID=UPI0020BF0016|nr:ROK family protein [Altererythrobacter sp. KTW20L]MCL6251668.1 ROK family protein [Altererythrobacter sp. KTW20L]
MGLIGALEAGGTKFVLAVARGDGTVVDRTRIDTRDPATTFAEMTAWFDSVQEPHGPIAAFGVASFGPIDIARTSPTWGTITTTPKPGWSGASYVSALGPFGVPLAIDSDVNGAALGEWKSGAGQGLDCVAYTTIGTGIGTGVVSHGRSLGGLSHLEAGHIRLARAPGDSWPGQCPWHGDCFEGLACGPAIKARWGHDLSHASPAEVELVADYVAQFAATLALLHMPERMIFGGGVMKAPGLIGMVREKTRALLAGYVAAYDRDLAEVIVLPGLGDDAGITGAIELGRQVLEG